MGTKKAARIWRWAAGIAIAAAAGGIALSAIFAKDTTDAAVLGRISLGVLCLACTVLNVLAHRNPQQMREADYQNGYRHGRRDGRREGRPVVIQMPGREQLSAEVARS